MWGKYRRVQILLQMDSDVAEKKGGDTTRREGYYSLLVARGIRRHLLRHHPTSPTRPLPVSDSYCYACLFPRFVDAPGVDVRRESQQWPGVAVQSRVGNWAAWAAEVAGMFGEIGCMDNKLFAWAQRVTHERTVQALSSSKQTKDLKGRRLPEKEGSQRPVCMRDSKRCTTALHMQS
jgi:hypothetical protein